MLGNRGLKIVPETARQHDNVVNRSNIIKEFFFDGR